MYQPKVLLFPECDKTQIVYSLCETRVVVDAPFRTENGEQLVSRKMASYVVSNLRVGVSEKTIYFRSFRDYVQ